MRMLLQARDLSCGCTDGDTLSLAVFLLDEAAVVASWYFVLCFFVSQAFRGSFFMLYDKTQDGSLNPVFSSRIYVALPKASILPYVANGSQTCNLKHLSA